MNPALEFRGPATFLNGFERAGEAAAHRSLVRRLAGLGGFTPVLRAFSEW